MAASAAPPAPCPPLRRVIVANEHAPHAARSFIRHVFGDADDLLMVVSELVTNAVVHVPGGLDIAVSFQRVPGGVLAEVADASRKPPELRQAAGLEESGRGLAAVVAALSVRWGWRAQPWGKVVWAVVPLDGLPQAPAARASPSISAGGRKAAPGD